MTNVYSYMYTKYDIVDILKTGLPIQLNFILYIFCVLQSTLYIYLKVEVKSLTTDI